MLLGGVWGKRKHRSILILGVEEAFLLQFLGLESTTSKIVHRHILPGLKLENSFGGDSQQRNFQSGQLIAALQSEKR